MGRLKTFEDFLADMTSAEEIEKDMVATGEPKELDIEDGEELEQTNEAEEESEEAETEEAEKEEETEDSEDEEESDDDDDDEEDDDDDDEEESEESEESKEEVETVSELLEKCYEMVKNEAKVWEEDMHDTHTVESYLEENAMLVASLATKALTEMKKDLTKEAFEAACNKLVEAYSKKINEIKEGWAAEGEVQEAPTEDEPSEEVKED